MYSCTSCDKEGTAPNDPVFADCYAYDHEVIKFLGDIKPEVSLKNLCSQIEDIFPTLSESLVADLAVVAQLKIEGLTQPFSLIKLGNPSTYKSTILKMLTKLPEAYISDNFTPRSFVSHSANTKKSELEQIDLLPRIKHKVLITPELAPMFKARAEEAEQLFGILTRILDGHGYKSDSGVHGSRGYQGDYNFMWLGAVVEIPNQIWRLLGNLGHKIYFYRMPENHKSNEDILRTIRDDDYSVKVEKGTEAVCNFWNSLPKKVKWNKIEDEEETLENILLFAKVLSLLRADIPSWHNSEEQFTESPIIEDPTRATHALYNIARGHAVLHGRDHITREDLRLVEKVALDSAPKKRTKIFEALIKTESLKTTDIIDATQLSKPTAISEMKKLEKVGLVSLIEDGNGIQISLNEKFGHIRELLGVKTTLLEYAK